MFNVCQQVGETLKEFLFRFTNIVVQSNQVQTICDKNGLRASPFNSDLSSRLDKDMEVIQTQSREFICWEERDNMKMSRELQEGWS